MKRTIFFSIDRNEFNYTDVRILAEDLRRTLGEKYHVVILDKKIDTFSKDQLYTLFSNVQSKLMPKEDIEDDEPNEKDRQTSIADYENTKH